MIPSPVYLILMLTSKCNLKCRYCYLGSHADTLKKNQMSLKTIDHALGLAAKGKTFFHVQISGGEPLLVPHLIEYVSKKARQIRSDVSIGLQTNATLMDEKAIKLIKQSGLKTGVSLDGDPSLQESLRGKADATFKGLHLLEKSRIPFNVTTVVTKANADKLHRLVLLLGGFSMARGIGLDPLVLKGNAKKNAISQAGHAQIKSGIEKMLKALRLVNAHRQIPLVTQEMEKLRKKRGKGALTHFCHAAAGHSLAVTSEGKLFPCSQTAYDRRFYIGTLDCPGSWKHSSELGAFDLRSISMDICRNCGLNQSCPGDCPSRLYYNQNDNPGLVCTIYQSLASHMDANRYHDENCLKEG